MKETIIVNLFGEPGAGKSTGAAYIFAMLKIKGIDAELATEFAKDKLWEESKAVFENQNYIFGKQSFRLSRCKGKVDVIVTDSPILLSVIYDGDNENTEKHNNFVNYVFNVFDSFTNKNYFLKRVKPYNPNGRFQTEEEAGEIGCEIKDMLDKYVVNYTCKDGYIDGYNEIVDEIAAMVFAKNENDIIERFTKLVI